MIQRTDITIVTGAFGEIGRTVCGRLVRRGCRICRVARTPDPNLSPIPEGPGTIMDVEADVASGAGWERIAGFVEAAGGRIGTLIHCAGALIAGDVPSAATRGIEKMLDDNILSLILGCRAVIPRMLRSGAGRIIVLGSLGGIVPMPHVSVYSASKFAVRGFTLSLAEELRDSGIDVSLISCGPVRSRMLLDESFHPGPIGFVTSPLAPATVAGTVMDILDRPRREVVLPRSAGWISRVAGAHARVFRLLYPLASVIGESRKRAYRDSAATTLTGGGS